MKELALTYNFNDAEMPIGQLTLSTQALEILANHPEHVIAFGFYRDDSGKWQTISAALIPSSNVLQGKLEDAYNKRIGGEEIRA